MAQLLHKGNFTDGGRGCALLRVEVNLLERDQLTRLAVAALEDLLCVNTGRIYLIVAHACTVA